MGCTCNKFWPLGNCAYCRQKKDDEFKKQMEQMERLAALEQQTLKMPPPPPLPSLADTLKLLQLYGAVQGPILGAAPKPLEKSLVAGPILGWRLWRANTEGTLMSVYKDVLWPPGRPLHAKPQNRDEGIYCLKERTKLDGRGYALDSSRLWMVVGQVAIWGTVIEHERGYRAEYGYPALIDLSPPMPGFPVPVAVQHLAERIRNLYGCEVRI